MFIALRLKRCGCLCGAQSPRFVFDLLDDFFCGSGYRWREAGSSGKTFAFNAIDRQSWGKLVQNSCQLDSLSYSKSMRGAGEHTRWNRLCLGIEAIDRSRFGPGSNSIDQEHALKVLPGFHQPGSFAWLLKDSTIGQVLCFQRPRDDQSNGVIEAIVRANANDEQRW